MTKTPCVISSSAGAGSGEFHLYRKMRRKEQEREEVRNMKFFQVFLQSLIFLRSSGALTSQAQGWRKFSIPGEMGMIFDQWSLNLTCRRNWKTMKQRLKREPQRKGEIKVVINSVKTFITCAGWRGKRRRQERNSWKSKEVKRKTAATVKAPLMRKKEAALRRKVEMSHQSHRKSLNLNLL